MLGLVLRDRNKYDTFSRFDTILSCDKQMDEHQRSCCSIHTMCKHHAVKNWNLTDGIKNQDVLMS